MPPETPPEEAKRLAVPLPRDFPMWKGAVLGAWARAFKARVSRPAVMLPGTLVLMQIPALKRSHDVTPPPQAVYGGGVMRLSG